MTDSPTEATNDAMAERLLALQASRAAAKPAESVGPASTQPGPSPKASTSRSTGPAPARIVAAAASVAAGIGLVTLMAGAQQDIVVQVNPTPVTVQPASVIVEMPVSANSTSVDEVQVRVVEAAVPAERPVQQAKVVSQSEGS